MAVYTRKETGKLFVKFMINGATYRRYVPEAKTKTQARLVEARMRQEIYEGRYGREAGSMGFVEFVNRHYRPHAEMTHKSWHRGKNILNMLCEAFKGRRLRDITPMIIEGWKRRRLSEITVRGRLRHPATVKMELRFLSSIFSMAVDNDLCPSNPCRKVKFKRGETVCKRTRVLSEDEETRLMKALGTRPVEVKRAVLLGLNTGMRRMEILSLRWRNVDTERGTIFVTKTKSGKDRAIPMNDEVRAQFKEIPRAGDYVFESRKGHNLSDPTGAFHRALREAGIDGFRFHDLRRTFASRVKNHTDAFTLQAILGHSSLAMTDLYAQVSLEDMRSAVDSLNGGKIVEFVPHVSQARSA